MAEGSRENDELGKGRLKPELRVTNYEFGITNLGIMNWENESQ